MSIDEDGGVAARGNNHEDCEDNGDDDDTGCDLLKCFNGNDNTSTSASSILSWMMTMMMTLTKHTIMII